MVRSSEDVDMELIKLIPIMNVDVVAIVEENIGGVWIWIWSVTLIMILNSNYINLIC